MAILDGLLLDNLLENIAKSEVYIALRDDLKDDPNRFGAGTAEDPYDGSRVDLGGGAYFYKFDKIMRDLVVANSTVVLSPGIFPTRGYRNDSSSEGWSAKSGLRITGGGWAGANTGGTVTGATVLALILTGSDTGENYAVACGTAADKALDGFELDHVSIDAGLPSSGALAAGAVNVNGKHIHIHHVRAFNFGSRTTECNVIQIARPTVNQNDVYDCVASDCVIENPSSNSTGTVRCLRMTATPDGATPYYHRACVFRNNYINCGQTADFSKDFIGIDVAGGMGSFVEMNRVWNCRTAGPRYTGERGNWCPTRDLFIRDNHFYNVLYGLFWQVAKTGTAWQVGRLLLQSNLIELATSGSPIAIEISGEGALGPIEYLQVILRQNQIRHIDAQTGPSGTLGINLDSVQDAIVEENLINVGPTPESPDSTKGIVRNSTVLNIKTFNNQSTAGVFLGCWDGTKHDGDLVTDIEDMMIGIL